MDHENDRLASEEQPFHFSCIPEEIWNSPESIKLRNELRKARKRQKVVDKIKNCADIFLYTLVFGIAYIIVVEVAIRMWLR